jgi:hypothetical protein
MLFSMFNRACQAAKITGSISRDQYREQLTIKVCGDLVSWNDLNNRQIDAIKAELLAILRPADLDAQLRQINQPRSRAMHSILNHNPQYVSAIVDSRFGGRSFELLSDTEIHQLAMTLSNRARSRRKKAEEPF